jgi:hypothetical protein
MKRKNNLIRFGEDIEGYSIPVLNEREIRAAAGILFLLVFISFMLIQFKGNFLMIKYVVTVFLTDLLIRVFINPRFSPFLIIGRLIVSNQTPEYVGAAQKKFAWKIGIAVAGIMFFFLVLVNSYSIITGLGCLICLAFLFFESAFGICLGCLVYRWFNKTKGQYCPGEACDTTKHDIQKITWAQILIVVGLIAYVLLIIIFFNQYLTASPGSLWKKLGA